MTDIEVEYSLPDGVEIADYDFDKGFYKCPSCGEYAASRHSGKKIGDCNSCGQNLVFHKRTTTFVKED